MNITCPECGKSIGLVRNKGVDRFVLGDTVVQTYHQGEEIEIFCMSGNPHTIPTELRNTIIDLVEKHEHEDDFVGA